jgi:hypothetical protein
VAKSCLKPGDEKKKRRDLEDLGKFFPFYPPRTDANGTIIDSRGSYLVRNQFGIT